MLAGNQGPVFYGGVKKGIRVAVENTVPEILGTAAGLAPGLAPGDPGSRELAIQKSSTGLGEPTAPWRREASTPGPLLLGSQHLPGARGCHSHLRTTKQVFQCSLPR